MKLAWFRIVVVDKGVPWLTKKASRIKFLQKESCMANNVPVEDQPTKDKVEDPSATEKFDNQPASASVENPAGRDGAEDLEESSRLFFLEILNSITVDDNFRGNIRNVRYPPNFTGNRDRSRSPFR